MAIFRIQSTKLTPLEEVQFESYFEKEKKLQAFTEANLYEIFGFEFISTEFNLEQFWLDSLAFDPASNSFVIIEYKKVENFSLMDQGQTYLNLVLDHKDSIILEYIEKTGKSIKRKDIDWSQTKVVFIGPKFNTYQKRALSESLPFELWEVTIYDGGLIEYDQINPVTYERKSEKKQVKTLSGSAAKEIAPYTLDNLVKPSWELTKQLLHAFEEQLLTGGIETRVKYNKHYIAYISKHGRNYVEIEPQLQGLKIYYRFPSNYHLRSDLNSLPLEDCSKIGRFANGISRILITDLKQIFPAVNLAKDSFYYLHRDIYK